MNITQRRHGDGRIYMIEDGLDYLALWQKFEAGTLTAQKLGGANEAQNAVYLVEHKGKKYIFKRCVNDDNRFKKSIVDAVHGTFYVYCMKRAWKAHHRGSHVAPLIFFCD